MPRSTLPPAPSPEPTPEPTLGELVQRASADLSDLVRQEIALATLEVKQEVAGVGKGAGLFGGAGAAVLLAVVFLGAAAAFGLGELWTVWAGFLTVGGAFALAAVALAVSGKRAFGKVGPPTNTLGTVKDDVAWVKHPTQKVQQSVP